jgi:hypothetical protein
MGTYRSENKLKQLVRRLLKLLGITAINLQMGGVASAQQPDVGVSLLIPSAAYSETFTSSLIIQNMSAFSTGVDISAYDTAGSLLGTLLRINLPGRGRFWSSNILKDLGAPLGSFGPIRVRSDNNQMLSAVSEVRSGQGFGGFFPGQDISRAVNHAMILDVVDDGPRGVPNTFRTNLGLNVVGSWPARVTISLLNDSGQLAGNTIATTVAGNGLTQLDGIVQRLRGAAALTRGYLLISSDQLIIAWASKIDNGTDDPSFQIGIEFPLSLIASQSH